MQDIKRVFVSNMVNGSGRDVVNQFEIRTNDGIYFQSYRSVIVFIPKCNLNGEHKIYLDNTYWDYSLTTSKYRNLFLNETKKDTEKKIATGEYVLIDLN